MAASGPAYQRCRLPARAGRVATTAKPCLLPHVGHLVRQQRLATGAGWVVGARRDEHVGAYGERGGFQLAGQRAGSAVGVHSHRPEIGAEEALQRGAGGSGADLRCSCAARPPRPSPPASGPLAALERPAGHVLLWLRRGLGAGGRCGAQRPRPAARSRCRARAGDGAAPSGA